jgi:hypothetical protein
VNVHYFPSFHGDFRLLDTSESTYRDRAEGSVLEVVSPTFGEREKLNAFLAIARKKRWTSVRKLGDEEKQEILLSVSVDAAGKVLLPLLKPADRTITAIRSEDGKLSVHDTAEFLAEPAETAPTSGDVVNNADVPGLDKPRKKGGKKKVSLARPTPSCPQCVPGAINRASEVLLSFLTPEEHDTWARRRFVIVEGGLTGHRYVVAHRHSETAQRLGRICFDIDDGVVVHFHDNSVPPEEEVLAAALILQHREPWLRNEATMLGVVYSDLYAERMVDGTTVVRLPDGGEVDVQAAVEIGNAQLIFKNPFGGGMDGVWDAKVTQALGTAFSLFNEVGKIEEEMAALRRRSGDEPR